jgi:hypothetical protein
VTPKSERDSDQEAQFILVGMNCKKVIRAVGSPSGIADFRADPQDGGAESQANSHRSSTAGSVNAEVVVAE